MHSYGNKQVYMYSGVIDAVELLQNAANWKRRLDEVCIGSEQQHNEHHFMALSTNFNTKEH